MPNISRDDYRLLELKIQREIKKIFSEFLEDRENKSLNPDETAPPQKQPKPGHPRTLGPAGTTHIPAEAKKDRLFKKLVGINKTLYSASPAGTHNPRTVLESDMAKIFRKKQKKGSQE